MARREDIEHEAEQAWDHCSALEELVTRARDPGEAEWALSEMMKRLYEVRRHLIRIVELASAD